MAKSAAQKAAEANKAKSATEQQAAVNPAENPVVTSDDPTEGVPTMSQAEHDAAVIAETLPVPEPIPDAEPEAAVGQRKVGRGSTRRIVKALNAYEAAVEALTKELDLQIYLTNEKNERVGPWPIIAELKVIPEGIRREVMAVLNGHADGETAEDTETATAE